jgi:hypothetical protein
LGDLLQEIALARKKLSHARQISSPQFSLPVHNYKREKGVKQNEERLSPAPQPSRDDEEREDSLSSTL